VSNPGAVDAEHPIYLSHIQLVDVEEKSKVFAHRPGLGYVLFSRLFHFKKKTVFMLTHSP